MVRGMETVSKPRPRFVVRYSESFGRMGSLSETFIASDLELRGLKAAREVDQGEALGKHSEVTSTLDDKTLTVVCDDEAFIARALELGVLDGCDMWSIISDRIDNYGVADVFGDRLTPEEIAELALVWSFDPQDK